jgi:hypothetical protein
MALWGCARGHSVALRLTVLASPGRQPNPLLDTLPRRQTLGAGSAEPLLRKRSRPRPSVKPSRLRTPSPPALSRCRFHLFDVVATSFLPKTQSEGGQLASHCQPHQFRFATERHPLPVKLLPRPGLLHRAAGRRFENLFQLPLVIGIQSTDGGRFTAALQLTIHHAKLRAHPRHQTQSHGGPEEPLAAEAEGRLHPGQQQSNAHRAQAGHSLQAAAGRVPPAFRQQQGRPFIMRGAKRRVRGRCKELAGTGRLRRPWQLPLDNRKVT